MTGSVTRLNSAFPSLGLLFGSVAGDEKILFMDCLDGAVLKSPSSVSSEHGDGTSSHIGMGVCMAEVYIDNSARILLESVMEMGAG